MATVTGCLKAIWLESFGTVFLGFSAEADPRDPLDRRNPPRTSISTKNQPRRPSLRPSGDELGLRLGLRCCFFVEIDVRGWPRRSRGSRGSASAKNDRKTGPSISSQTAFRYPARLPRGPPESPKQSDSQRRGVLFGRPKWRPAHPLGRHGGCRDSCRLKPRDALDMYVELELTFSELYKTICSDLYKTVSFLHLGF